MNTAMVIGASVGLALFVIGLLVLGIGFLALGWLIPVLMGYLVYFIVSGHEVEEKKQ